MFDDIINSSSRRIFLVATLHVLIKQQLAITHANGCNNSEAPDIAEIEYS